MDQPFPGLKEGMIIKWHTNDQYAMIVSKKGSGSELGIRWILGAIGTFYGIRNNGLTNIDFPYYWRMVSMSDIPSKYVKRFPPDVQESLCGSSNQFNDKCKWCKDIKTKQKEVAAVGIVFNYCPECGR